MKIAFVSHNPFGLQGTPGTYKLIEAFARIADVWAYSGKPRDDISIVSQNGEISVTETSFDSSRDRSRLAKDIARKMPDIVYFCGGTLWSDNNGHLLKSIKSALPSAKIVLDIKSPPLIKDSKQRCRLQKEASAQVELLDAIFSRAQEDVDDWFGTSAPKAVIYPLGAPEGLFTSFADLLGQRTCRRFVYIGAIHPRRQLDQLLRCIESLPAPIKRQVSIDVFGSGPSLPEFRRLVWKTGLEGVVNIHGPVFQNVLFELLPKYDVGLGWIPHEIYNHAPSLKTLEYMSAGLVPLISNTKAHKKLIEQGFHCVLFDNSSEGFRGAVETLLKEGFPQWKIAANLERIKEQTWDKVVREYLYPFLLKLISEQGGRENGTAIQAEARWRPMVRPFESSRQGAFWLSALCIVSERLYYGLRSECRLHLLPQHNWQDSLVSIQADCLLVESSLYSVLDDWRFSQGPEPSSDLISLLKAAKNRGLTSIFWITAGAEYFDIYSSAARYFDYVFAADSLMIERLQRVGIGAGYLPPAFQPRLFNPLRPLRAGPSDVAPYLVNGIYTAEDSLEVSKAIETCQDIRFTAFERCHVPTVNNVARIEKLLPNLNIKGKLSYRMLPEVLKNSKALIVSEKANLTSTEFAWQALENAACGCLTLIIDMKGDESSSPYIKRFASASELAGWLKMHNESEVALGASCLGAWRHAFSNDTYEQRVRAIGQIVGKFPASTDLPLVTIVTPTMRCEQIEHILSNFRRQTYPRKELIIVVNQGEREYLHIKNVVADEEGVRAYLMPSDYRAATALNLGAQLAKGNWLFRFDDDDSYGSEYIADSLLMLKADASDLIGKFASFVQVSDEADVYHRPHIESSFMLRAYKAADLGQIGAALSGATFGIRVDILQRCPFPDESLSTADSGFLEKLRVEIPDARIVKTDWYNYTMGRRRNGASHTWRTRLSNLIDKERPVPAEIAEVPR